MADIDPKDLFFTQTDLDLQQAVKFTENALHGADDGELYLEYTLSEAFSFDDNRLKAASFDTAQGFGLRAVNDEAVGYAHATDLSPAALKRAADSLTGIGRSSGHMGASPECGGQPALCGRKPARQCRFHR